jgi:hypothetical protein
MSSPVSFLIVPSSIPCGKQAPIRPIVALVPRQIVAGGVFLNKSRTTCPAHLLILELALSDNEEIWDFRHYHTDRFYSKDTYWEEKKPMNHLNEGKLCSEHGLTAALAYPHPPFYHYASHSPQPLSLAHILNLWVMKFELPSFGS